MSAVFFEWADFEQQIATQHNIQFPDTKFVPGVFTLEAALGSQWISVFVDSKLSNSDLEQLHKAGLQGVLVRAAGYDMLDLEYAKQLGLKVYRVASYSPESVAEHVFALLLTIARRLNVERELHQQLVNKRTVDSMGFTLNGKTLGIFGMGKVGSVVAKIAIGFGMQVQYCDKGVDSAQSCTRLPNLQNLFALSDVVSIHVPLLPETKHIVNAEALAHAKPGMTLINTARGDVMDSEAVVQALENGQLGGLGVDVWDSGLVDDKFDQRLLKHNVIQTHHVAFFTREAVTQILQQTHDSLLGQPASQNVLAA